MDAAAQAGPQPFPIHRQRRAFDRQAREERREQRAQRHEHDEQNAQRRDLGAGEAAVGEAHMAGLFTASRRRGLRRPDQAQQVLQARQIVGQQPGQLAPGRDEKIVTLRRRAGGCRV